MIAIKDKIKKMINYRKSADLKSTIDVLENYKVVSFDIFDTLLKRNVDEPADVFSLMQVELDEFKTKRIEAEIKARKLSKEKEITLNDIYDCFNELSCEQKKEYMKKELHAEEKCLCLNRDIYPIYRWCVENNKKIYIVSDMYLPEWFIVKMLNKCGIDKYNKLYLSSTTKRIKNDGSAFEGLLEEQAITPLDIIHIGDSIRGDDKEPSALGIKALRISRYINRKEHTYVFTDKLKANYFNQFLNNTIDLSKNDYYKFGYECFGPMLWGYVRWLYKNITDEGITKVYFFSRDGLIMKKAFDICFSNCGIESYYLEVSRRSLRIPILWIDNSVETVLNMLSPSKLISIASIFDGVGLDVNDYLEIVEQYGFTDETIFDRAKILQDMQFLKLFDDLKQDISKVSRKEYENLEKYIKQNNLSGHIAVVDIGWSGGMQRYLEQTLEKLSIPHQIWGYYTGVASYFLRNTEVCPDLDMKGYLFDFKNDINAEDKRNCFVGLFETFFLEQGGSVKNYSIDENGYAVTNRYSYEYIIDGNYTKEYIYVSNIQKGALDFVEKASQNEYLSNQNYTSTELFSCLQQCGANPRRKEIELFSEFRFFDEGITTRLADPQNLLYYVFHFNQLKNDFLMSRWKTGFMKKLLRIKLPYEKIYNMLLNLK